MKRRHAKGYRDYARQDGLTRHQARLGGTDYAGYPLCICTYPLMLAPEEKRKRREVKAFLKRQQANAVSGDSEVTKDSQAS